MTWHTHRRWGSHDTILLKAMRQCARPQDYIIIYDGHEKANRPLIYKDLINIFGTSKIANELEEVTIFSNSDIDMR